MRTLTTIKGAASKVLVVAASLPITQALTNTKYHGVRKSNKERSTYIPSKILYPVVGTIAGSIILGGCCWYLIANCLTKGKKANTTELTAMPAATHTHGENTV